MTATSAPRRVSGASTALFALLLALVAAGCGRAVSDPELQIREMLAEAELAAEAGDHEALARRVARDYGDREGRDRRHLVYLVRGLLTRYPRLELIVTVREIEILAPDLARVRLELLSAGAGPRGISADAFPVDLSLRDSGDGWEVIRAEWGRRLGHDI
jgi:hypothetical protein